MQRPCAFEVGVAPNRVAGRERRWVFLWRAPRRALAAQTR